MCGYLVGVIALFYSTRLSNELVSSLQAVQNEAVRKIFHLSKLLHTSTSDLCKMASLSPIRVRLAELNANYFDKSLENGNELIVSLFEWYKNEYVRKGAE